MQKGYEQNSQLKVHFWLLLIHCLSFLWVTFSWWTFLQFLKRVCTQQKILGFWITFLIFSRISLGVLLVLCGTLDRNSEAMDQYIEKFFFINRSKNLIWNLEYIISIVNFLIYWPNRCTLQFSVQTTEVGALVS